LPKQILAPGSVSVKLFQPQPIPAADFLINLAGSIFDLLRRFNPQTYNTTVNVNDGYFDILLILIFHSLSGENRQSPFILTCFLVLLSK
jgi:hypothetical protein